MRVIASVSHAFCDPAKRGCRGKETRKMAIRSRLEPLTETTPTRVTKTGAREPNTHLNAMTAPQQREDGLGKKFVFFTRTGPRRSPRDPVNPQAGAPHAEAKTHA